MEFTSGQIAALLNGKVEGDADIIIRMVGKIEDAKNDQLAFLSNPAYEKYLYESNAGAILIKEDLKLKGKVKSTLIRVKDPYGAFSALLKEYEKLLRFQVSGIEQPSFIDKSVNFGSDIYVGAFSYIAAEVKIGDNVKIHPQCHIGKGTIIGDNVIIYPGVKIYQEVIIGNNCTIHSGAVLGSDGFGFAPKEDGTYDNIPQLGSVQLEDNVSIGANTVIDRATLPGEFTIIRKGTKLDNLIQIGHNVEIGKNTVIAAQTGIAGSSKVGENCMIAGQVGIAGHLKVPKNTKVGAQTGIAGHIRKEGLALFGTPGIPIKDFMRSFAVFKELPTLNKDLREVKKKTSTEE